MRVLGCARPARSTRRGGGQAAAEARRFRGSSREALLLRRTVLRGRASLAGFEAFYAPLGRVDGL